MSCPRNVKPLSGKCGDLPLDQNFFKGGGVLKTAQNVFKEMIHEGSNYKVEELKKIPELSGLLNGQKGGRDSNGYYLGVGEPNMGGLSEVVPYETCNAPVFPTQCRDLRGGKSKRKRRVSKRKARRKSRKTRKSRKSRKTRKSRKSRKTLTSRSRKTLTSRSRKMKGGNSVDPYKLSGLPSNFSPDMTTREFGCKTPYWTPKCV